MAACLTRVGSHQDDKIEHSGGRLSNYCVIMLRKCLLVAASKLFSQHLLNDATTKGEGMTV